MFLATAVAVAAAWELSLLNWSVFHFRNLNPHSDYNLTISRFNLCISLFNTVQVGSLKAQLEVARGMIPEEQLEALENALGKAKKSSAEEDGNKAKESSETEELDRKLQSLNLDIVTRFKEMEVKNLEMEAQLPVRVFSCPLNL